MLTIDLKALGRNVGSAAEFLQSRLDDQVRIKHSRVRLANTNARTVRSLLNKFLNQVRVDGYRVVVVNSELIEIRAPKEKKARIDPTVQPAWETIPTCGTQLLQGSSGQVRGARERKRAIRGL